MTDMLKRFTVSGGFMGRYEKLVSDVVIPYQEKVLNDEIEGAEKSHAIENFRAAAEKLKTGKCGGEFYGMVFQDSDVAKWLEAAAYSLLRHPDPALQKRCDDVIDLIESAQQEDGYLNTYFTVKEPEKRWTNLHEAHELYCAGHMMEAAAAYYECTGKTKLLSVMCKMADHIYKRFVEEKAEGYPGHPEVELALMRLFRCTGNMKYKELAEHFINVRGVDSDYFIRERERYPWSVWGGKSRDMEYYQCHKPVREQTKAVGHAVRAAYLYTGMADAAAEMNDESLKKACKTLWNNMTQCRMYVTGGIGSAYEGEKFTVDYHLPNDTAYAETCASIALIFFARKMLDIEKSGEYADVMERALYNCVLAGMELNGTRFFYVNPLEVVPGISGEAVTHRHALPIRPKWFSCACCPPNVARLLTSLGRYAWSQEGDTLYSHLFISGTLDVSDTLGGKITVETGYPYDGRVTYRFEPDGENMQAELAIRLPGWSCKTTITLNGTKIAYENKDGCAYVKNGAKIAYKNKDGYAYVKGGFIQSDEITVTFDMEVKRIFASTFVSADSGRAAFQRGPLVYCLEGKDNGGDVLPLSVKKEAAAEVFHSDKLGGIMEIHIDGYKTEKSGTLYSYNRPEVTPCKLKLIPYYAWGNRGLNSMRVWIPEAE
jgi:uncharacterized protein